MRQLVLRINPILIVPKLRFQISSGNWRVHRNGPSIVSRRKLTTKEPSPPSVGKGTGAGEAMPYVVTRGPVSWAGLGLAALLAATAVGYYKIERERRLENAMGKIVSSESGWSPNPELFAPRKYVVCSFGEVEYTSLFIMYIVAASQPQLLSNSCF